MKKIHKDKHEKSKMISNEMKGQILKRENKNKQYLWQARLPWLKMRRIKEKLNEIM